ncbi:MAG: hypothetical protein A3B23_01475 [Candidatus Colwellbacteria bacterium RIFCSPLOWO2_01_FULL_48_10]|uniref:FtsK domain-containing protein n=1 Tax=Candidatus Colwellbacteria bacterium RIFCSPLOWO2_01_FULL_48_10 TaxID=1797690 RepID=A0A1G1Z5Z6_9BACT|nr:MAG: hypothetical protein A3B23_01475 [Candidatus Colwellbacteria bacterium RIFCSPLOWO2_01_FULL_48_10]
MSRKSKRNKKENLPVLKSETKNSAVAVLLVGLSIILLLSGFQKAGPIGRVIFNVLGKLFGGGYFLIPVVLLLVSLVFLIGEHKKLIGLTMLGSGLFVFCALGIVEIVSPDNGGLIGKVLGSFDILFGYYAGIIFNLTLMVVSVMIALNSPLKFNFNAEDQDVADKNGKDKKPRFTPAIPPEPAEDGTKILIGGEEVTQKEMETAEKETNAKKEETAKTEKPKEVKPLKVQSVTASWKNYVPPPIALLKTSNDKPTVGDLRGNANIIKRTLESFGIAVEMGEITIGPKVTRYTMKPAEGVKLSRIVALNQDLSLALAAHPIRIEAPIPGKALVGIEIPNKTATIVRLGNLLGYSDFASAPYLTFALGRDVGGEPVFANLAKMPHLMIAGTTGSGKSIMIHTLLVSLLYKNSPETMRMILIDPKRVELSVYEGIPHLMAPVITGGKKAVAALRFAIEEMDRRYGVLLNAGKRDILGYNDGLTGQGRKEGIMPYIVIVIDELADLMMTYGREVENSIVRLAQMARATGIHVVLSTQRPSVEVITGLIKANISSRIALQVASQIDSRTILDMSGAEKLLGGGDMLFTSTELSKPKRIQGAYMGSDEVEKVIEFINKENPAGAESGGMVGEIAETLEKKISEADFSDDDDELLNEAVEIVRASKKASASLLQRRLKVGYARAARLLDIMEEKGVIGPGDGAKPREVFIDNE